jgi:hypothetical protein
MSVQATSRSFSYAVIRYLVDAERDVSVPIGIALTAPDEGYLRFRLPQEGERIPDVPTAAAKPVVELARTKIEHWLRTGEVPYAKQPLEPLSEAWWDQARKLMQFRVRIGAVQPIDCQRPEEEIETLYEAIVKPHVSPQARAERINGAVTRALGNLARSFRYGKSVPGFGNRPVPVLRHIADANHLVVVEAVNLAVPTAEKDSDAMTSKLLRIKAVNANTRFVIGYLASPHGLNGEWPLKKWMEDQVGAPLFDLTRESDKFRDTAFGALTGVQDDLDITRQEPMAAR